MASTSGIPLILTGPAANIHAADLNDLPGLSIALSPYDVLQQIQTLIKPAN
jgi:hypothetical protein